MKSPCASTVWKPTRSKVSGVGGASGAPKIAFAVLNELISDQDDREQRDERVERSGSSVGARPGRGDRERAAAHRRPPQNW